MVSATTLIGRVCQMLSAGRRGEPAEALVVTGGVEQVDRSDVLRLAEVVGHARKAAQALHAQAVLQFVHAVLAFAAACLYLKGSAGTVFVPCKLSDHPANGRIVPIDSGCRYARCCDRSER